MMVLVPRGLVPDGACELQLRPATPDAEPTAPVRQIDAATALVDWLDRVRPSAPNLPPLSLPAAKTKIKRAVDRGALPAVGTGDECRISKADLDAWLLRYMRTNVFTADAETVAEVVEDPDADEPDDDEQAEIARRMAEARARKEAVRGNGERRT
jgi:excisionase family DNA binding protein